MNDKLYNDLLARIQRLEERAARFRVGTITSRTPIDVDLGDSQVDVTDVRAMGAFNDGSKVGCIVSGKDVVVLGALGYGMSYGSVQVTNDGDVEADLVVTHGLSATPHAIFLTLGESGNSQYVAGVQSKNGVDFTIRVRHTNALSTWTTGVWVYWLAIIGG